MENFIFLALLYIFIKALGKKKDKKKIHQRYIEQSKRSRGPASYTELFKVEFDR